MHHEDTWMRGCSASLRVTICPNFHWTALKMDLKLHVPTHLFLSYREFPQFCRWCLWVVDFQGGVSRSLNLFYCEKVVNVRQRRSKSSPVCPTYQLSQVNLFTNSCCCEVGFCFLVVYLVSCGF